MWRNDAIINNPKIASLGKNKNANSVDRTQDLQISWPKFFLQSGALPTELNPLTTDELLVRWNRLIISKNRTIKALKAKNVILKHILMMETKTTSLHWFVHFPRIHTVDRDTNHNDFIEDPFLSTLILKNWWVIG